MSAVASKGLNADPQELDKFSAIAGRWWDEHGPQKPLHVLNPLRLQYITQHADLAGVAALDIGCGGGLLSEAMAKQAARVTAIDLSTELIKIARLHALESKLQIDYRVQSLQRLAAEQPGQFDVITCMELLEHVPDPAAIIENCKRLLKPGGKLFLATVNRTPAAFALAIVGAEYITRLLPRGTHEYKKFIKPAELATWLRQVDLQLHDISGVAYEPWLQRARLHSCTAINYLGFASKPVT